MFSLRCSGKCFYMFRKMLLDVTFNLTNSTYRTYRKPSDNLLNIFTSSKPPLQIIIHLLDSVKEWLYNNLFNEQVFNSFKLEYEKAFEDSGYKNMNLKYRTRREWKKNNRNRKVTWFNPPYSKQVSTSIGKRFLNLLDQHFPKQHRLHKIFNKNNVLIPKTLQRSKIKSFWPSI